MYEMAMYRTCTPWTRGTCKYNKANVCMYKMSMYKTCTQKRNANNHNHKDAKNQTVYIQTQNKHGIHIMYNVCTYTYIV